MGRGSLGGEVDATRPHGATLILEIRCVGKSISIGIDLVALLFFVLEDFRRNFQVSVITAKLLSKLQSYLR